HQTIVGTDMPLLETIADKFNLLEAVERANIIRVAIETIKKLDESYPERGYLLLWQGLVQGKKQTLLARELKVTQGEVSRRRKELLQRLTQELGLVQPQPLLQQQTRNLKAERKRSSQKW
ncbi:MAG: sigma-70 family RNA polymerase sigma factor, partial [Cyanobacteria bacterium P01_A01_bin.80]